MQIKSSAGPLVLADYVHRFQSDPGFDRFFFVCHSPKGELRVAATDKPIHVWAGTAIARQAVAAGLFDWLVDKPRDGRLHYPSTRASRTACWLTPNCRAMTDGFIPALKAARMALTRAFGNGGAVRAAGCNGRLAPEVGRGRPGFGSAGDLSALAAYRRPCSTLTAEANASSSASDNQ